MDGETHERLLSLPPAPPRGWYPQRHGWQMNCPWCKTPFKRRQIDQVFCSKVCNNAATALELKRARTLYRCLYWWRFGRLSAARKWVSPVEAVKVAADSLRFVCREIALWIEQDKLDGRDPPPQHNHMADRGAQRQVRLAPTIPEEAREDGMILTASSVYVLPQGHPDEMVDLGPYIPGRAPPMDPSEYPRCTITSDPS